MRAVLAAIGMMVGMVGAAGAQVVFFKGNDTGGIIGWSCESELAAHELAAGHCARFGKYHRITSVHRQDGDYIGFYCLWNPRAAAFAIPAVRTRTAACQYRPPVVFWSGK